MKLYLLFFMYGLIVAALCGCLGKESTPSNYFLLNALPPATQSLLSPPAQSPAVAVSQAVLPAFLDRPQIMTSRGRNEINYAEFDRWAEPLEAGITRVLRENLGRLLEPEKVYAHPWSRQMPLDFQVHTVVSKFTAHLDVDEVELIVFWRIAGPEGRLVFVAQEKAYTTKIKGRTNNYSHIAQSMSNAIALCSQDIAQALLQLHAKSLP